MFKGYYNFLLPLWSTISIYPSSYLMYLLYVKIIFKKLKSNSNHPMKKQAVPKIFMEVIHSYTQWQIGIIRD